MSLYLGLLIAAGILAIALIAMQLGINRSVMQMMEQSPPLHAVENDPAPEAEPFSFRTADGLTLQGTLYPPTDQAPRGLVLFFHELGGDQWSASSYCEGLLNAGFAVVTFAFRNHDGSDRLDNYDSLHWLSEHELADIRGFLSYLESRADLSSLPWTAFGVSRGDVLPPVGRAVRPPLGTASDPRLARRTESRRRSPLQRISPRRSLPACRTLSI